eukprot:6183037-Pleurochrysis_carterae.AAC.4
MTTAVANSRVFSPTSRSRTPIVVVQQQQARHFSFEKKDSLLNCFLDTIPSTLILELPTLAVPAEHALDVGFGAMLLTTTRGFPSQQRKVGPLVHWELPSIRRAQRSFARATCVEMQFNTALRPLGRRSACRRASTTRSIS